MVKLKETWRLSLIYTGCLPDWLINPGDYEPVLPTTEECTAAELTEDKELDNEPRGLTLVYTYGSIN